MVKEQKVSVHYILTKHFLLSIDAKGCNLFEERAGTRLRYQNRPIGKEITSLPTYKSERRQPRRYDGRPGKVVKIRGEVVGTNPKGSPRPQMPEATLKLTPSCALIYVKEEGILSGLSFALDIVYMRSYIIYAQLKADGGSEGFATIVHTLL